MQADKILFILSSFCIFVGIVFSLSLPVYANISYGYNEFHFFIRQFGVGMFSILIMWLISRFNPDKSLTIMGFSIFLVCLILMGIMHFLPESMVTSAGGAKRWIRLPGLSLAPVEFFKVGFVYFLAWSFARKLDEKKKSLKDELALIWPYIAVFILIVYLIAVMQNDLGQVIVLALTLAIMLFFAGTSIKLFMISITGSIIIFLLAIFTSQHRILRIKVWWGTIQNMVLSIFPDSLAKTLRIDNAPEPYQISNSLNAINHGGLFGQGIGSGSFKLGFLSEVHTDFVLAGIAEEVGFIGLSIITLAIFLVTYRIFRIANRSDNRVYHLFATGIGLLIVFSFLMNAYGITSLTPIKGIAVPFLSYGGSSTLALAIGIGMVLMVSKRAKL